MGRKILKSSLLACHSVLSIFNRCVTLVFAIFCVISGLCVRDTVANENQNKKMIKGKVLNVIDSTIFRNIKLFLGDIECSITPWYGMGMSVTPLYGVEKPCGFVAVDSTVTDSEGNFEIGYHDSIFQNGSSRTAYFKIDLQADDNNKEFTISGHNLNPNSDTSIILYFNPAVSTSIHNKENETVTFNKAIQGKNVLIKIGDWSANQKYSAKIFNVAGELVKSPVISNDGFINWNAENCAKGVYLLKIDISNRTINTKINIK